MAPSAQEFENSQPTHTVENYLMTMHVMERDQGEIVAARLAEVLKVAPATVAMTLKRMERDHWISGKGRQGGIHLTEAGRASAQSVVRRHMLTEWLLLKILKVPLRQIHAEAHNLEHAISPFVEERLIDILGAPKVCPHGNPFPGYEDVTSAWLPLSAIPVGEQIRIRRLHEFAEDNQDLLEFLLVNGIVPGAQAVITEVLTFNQTLTLEINDQPVVLGFPAAHSLYAEIG
jgi:DtxR family Mn-dependent transcriptional regulator